MDRPKHDQLQFASEFLESYQAAGAWCRKEEQVTNHRLESMAQTATSGTGSGKPFETWSS